jgi:hypothetical protein
MNRLSSTATNSKLLEMFNVMKPRTTFLLLLSVFFFTFSGYAQDTVEPSLNTEEIELTSWLDSQEENMLEMLERITNINSGSLNKQGVNELASIFSEELRQLGLNSQPFPEKSLRCRAAQAAITTSTSPTIFLPARVAVAQSY